MHDIEIEVGSELASRAFMFKGFPAPDFIPGVFEVVKFPERQRTALVLTKPHDPDDVDPSTLADLDTRPCICDVMVGEETIKDVDVSRLCSLTPVDVDADELDE